MKRPILGFRAGFGLGLILLVAGSVGYFWWMQSEKDREIARLRKAIEHLTASYPIARLVVVDQQPAGPDRVQTRVRVAFVDDEGRRSGAPVETILPGERIYFEALLMIFENPLVQSGERRSMAFPTRLFTEIVPPERGYALNPLDERGVPVQYDRPGRPPSELSEETYREVLRRFWELANDPGRAAGYGIRVLQGQAVFTEYQIGRYYAVFVEADGGLSLRPELHWLDE